MEDHLSKRMQVTLQVKLHEVNQELLSLIQELLSRNAEVLIRKETPTFEEYNRQVPLDQVIKEVGAAGYTDAFLHDLREGLKTSSVYKIQHDN